MRCSCTTPTDYLTESTSEEMRVHEIDDLFVKDDSDQQQPLLCWFCVYPFSNKVDCLVLV